MESELVPEPTRWSVVWRAGNGTTRQMRAALQDICSTYWFPVYAFARRNGADPHEAEDLTQSFFADLIRRQYLAKADPARGRLRSFLFTALQRFLQNQWKRKNAQKRGGAVQFVTMDDAEQRYRFEPVEQLTPERLYQRRWALAVLEQAVRSVKAEYGVRGQAAIFEELRGCLGSDIDVAATPDYRAASSKLGMSGSALRTAVSRLRSRFRVHLHRKVAETIGSNDEEEVRSEIRDLLEHL